MVTDPKGFKQKERRKQTQTDQQLIDLLSAKKPKIKVVGAGGAGNNTVTRMMQVGIEGVESVTINTDAQDLLYSDSDVKVLIGKELTGGMGAGGDPRIGAEAAKENKDDIKKALEGSDQIGRAHV